MTHLEEFSKRGQMIRFNQKRLKQSSPFFKLTQALRAPRTVRALMRRYYFHTEVLELRRSMIVLEKNTLLRVTYAIIVYTNTRLETVPIPSEVLFTTSSTFKIKQNQIRSNKHEQDYTNDHFESFPERNGHLCRKFKTIISDASIWKGRFRSKITHINTFKA